MNYILAYIHWEISQSKYINKTNFFIKKNVYNFNLIFNYSDKKYKNISIGGNVVSIRSISG